MGVIGYPFNVATLSSNWIAPIVLFRIIPYLEEKNYYQTKDLLKLRDSQDVINKFILFIDEGNDIDITKLTPLLGFNVLTEFLRYVSKPIMGDYYNDLRLGLSSEDPIMRLDNLKEKINCLQQSDKLCLYYILKHMYNIYNQMDYNYATSEEIANEYGRCIFNIHDEEDKNIVKTIIPLILDNYSYVNESLNDVTDIIDSVPDFPCIKGDLTGYRNRVNFIVSLKLSKKESSPCSSNQTSAYQTPRQMTSSPRSLPMTGQSEVKELFKKFDHFIE